MTSRDGLKEETNWSLKQSEMLAEKWHCIAGGRLRYALLKRGAAGGLLYDARTGGTRAWAPRAMQVVDPTGAGDAFAGGFLSGLLGGEDVPGALERGVVSASFALEAWGAAGLVPATPADARQRRAEWFGTRKDA